MWGVSSSRSGKTVSACESTADTVFIRSVSCCGTYRMAGWDCGNMPACLRLRLRDCGVCCDARRAAVRGVSLLAGQHYAAPFSAGIPFRSAGGGRTDCAQVRRFGR